MRQHPGEQRKITRQQMLAMTERLIAEYAHTVPAGTVMRCVARCREQLQLAGMRDDLVDTTEATAREWLDTLVPAHAVPLPRHADRPRAG